MKRRGEVVRAVHDLGIAVSDEAIAHDQPQRNGRPGADLRKVEA
jgi:hypothetical protein